MSDNTSTKRYGFFSEAARKYGSWLYKTPDGKEVLVTHLTSEPEAPGYLWPDKASVGEVVPFQLGGCIREVDPRPRDGWMNTLKGP